MSLETRRLRLETFDVERHLTARYVAWLNDPEIVRYSEQRHRTHSLESCSAYAKSFEGTPNFLWAVVAKDERLGHIGNLNAYVDSRQGLADVGIIIGERAAQGLGLATEAWIAACDHLLRDIGIRKVTAGTLAVNESMLRVIARTGMVEDGRRIRHYSWNGSEIDVVHAALFRTAWLERYPAREDVPGLELAGKNPG